MAIARPIHLTNNSSHDSNVAPACHELPAVVAALLGPRRALVVDRRLPSQRGAARIERREHSLSEYIPVLSIRLAHDHVSSLKH